MTTTILPSANLDWGYWGTISRIENDPAADPDQVAATARAELELLADRARVGRCGPTPADVLADEAVERYGDPNIAPRLSTGWPDLDDVLGGGLVPGSVTVLAARPNVGKSVTGLGMAINAASAGHGVMAVTLEMSAAELTDRLIASLGSVTLDTLAARQFDDDQWARVVAGYDRLRELPLWIVDDPGLTVAAIGSAARDYYVDDQQRLRVVERLRGSGSVTNMEVQFRRADGCTMIYSVTALSSGKRLVCYYDISELKARERQLAAVSISAGLKDGIALGAAMEEAKTLAAPLLPPGASVMPSGWR